MTVEQGAPAGVPQRLWAASQVHHDEVRRTPLIVALTFARLPWSAYADWLAQLYFMHEFLAEAEDVMADDPVGLAMARSAAISLPALAADLDYFHGSHWQHRIIARPVTTVYCTHLRGDQVRKPRCGGSRYDALRGGPGLRLLNVGLPPSPLRQTSPPSVLRCASSGCG